MLILKQEEMSSGEIASLFDLTPPVISQHLKVLVEARLISLHKQGTCRLYRTRLEDLEEMGVYLENFWDERLRLLKAAAESEERKNEHDNIRTE